MDEMHRGIVESGSEEPRYVYCDACKYENKIAMADTYCVDCNEHLCPQCKHFHTKFQATRNHTLTDAGNATTNKVPKPLNLKLCDIHRTNEVKYYCNSHKSVICTICKASIHSSCKLGLITEVCQYEADRNQLNLTNDSIQDLTKSFKKSIQDSTNSILEEKTTVQQYRSKILQIKDRFGAILDKAFEDILMSERESEAKHSEDCEAVQVYQDVVNDLGTLSQNIEEVLETDDIVATFTGKLKALKLREEYSLIERKMKTKSTNAPADYKKYGQFIDEMENCLKLCESYINPTQPSAGHPNRQPQDHGQQNTHVEAEHGTDAQLEAYCSKVSSATNNPDLVTPPNEGQIHKQSKPAQRKRVEVNNTNEEVSPLPSNAASQTAGNNPNSKQTSKLAPQTPSMNIPLQCDKDNPKPLDAKEKEVHVQPTQATKQSPVDSNINDTTANPYLYSKIVQTTVEKPLKETFSNMKPSSMRHSMVKLPSDQHTCDITGSTFLQNGQLALCDRENMTIKLTNTAFEVTNSFKLDYKPWDITATAENELALTLPSNKTVRFIQIHDNTMTNGKKFQVKRNVWGIDSFQDLIIISLHDIAGSNAAVEIRQKTGKLIKEIKADILGNRFFKSPQYVLIEKQTGNIFVSDGKMHAVFCFTQEGTMIKKFENGGLRWPKKMITDSSGNLIICSRYSDSLKLLPPTGTQYWTFIDCDGPQTVSYRETDKLMIVGKNLCDTIFILQY